MTYVYLWRGYTGKTNEIALLADPNTHEHVSVFLSVGWCWLPYLSLSPSLSHSPSLLILTLSLPTQVPTLYPLPLRH